MFPERFCIKDIKRVIYVGSDEYKEPITVFGNNCISNELIFNLGGTATVRFNGKVMETKKGVVRFLPKGEVFEYIVERREIGDCIDIFFDADISLSEEAFCINVQDNKNIEALFRKAFSVWSGKGEGYYHKTVSILYEIIGELCSSRYNPKNKELIIEPAVKYISENYISENITVGYLAALCSVSESYLKKLFIARFGIPPKKYITKLRMEYAVELLSSGMFSVGRTAEILGYENIYYFSRAFKTEMGIAPSEYIRKCKSSK